MKQQLKIMYQQLLAKWSQLSARDKKILKLGGVFVAVLVAYAGVWSPLNDHVTMLRERVQSQANLLAFMQSADAILARDNQSIRVGPASLVEVLGDLKKQIGLAGMQSQVRLLKQNADDEIALNMQQVVFDQLVNLLLQQKHLQISQMTVIALPQVGMVNAQIIFKLIT